MSTTITPPAVVAPAPVEQSSTTRGGRERLLTAADLAVFPKSLPSGDAAYELDNGRLVVMAPPGGDHGRKQKHFVVALDLQGESRGYGVATGDATVILRRGPDRLVVPDATFTATESLPLRYSPEGYFETIPELVVEVRSKNDTRPEVEAKVQEYLAAGVVLVWVADRDAVTVTAYRADDPPRVYSSSDTLDADPVIPGFAMPVATLFRP